MAILRTFEKAPAWGMGVMMAALLAATVALGGCTVTKPEASGGASGAVPAASASAEPLSADNSLTAAQPVEAASGAGMRFAQAHVEDGLVVVAKEDIGDEATFINYDADGVTVQLLAVRSTNGQPHVALNTCQSCNPSPKAHFEQDGDTLTCQNCGLEFSVDTVGAVGASACNPAPIEGLAETDDAFTVPASTLDLYRRAFEQWAGPTA